VNSKIIQSLMAVVVVSAMLAMPVICRADGIYKWRDANGHIHFGDTPPSGTKSEQVTVRPNVYESPSFERLSKVFEPDNKVILYSASWCGYCKRARNYFNGHGIAYTEYDVETSEKGRRDYKRLGAKGVPVILVGNHRMNGFSAAAFEKFYRSATQ
jgi:glutaredoxin